MFKTLGEGFLTLGKAFAKCFSQQRTLGKKLVSKNVFVE
jgi:hypothetical protein